MAGIGLRRDGRLFPIHVDLHLVERNKCGPSFLRSSTHHLTAMADMALAFAHRENLLWPLCVSSAADAHFAFDLASELSFTPRPDSFCDLFSGSTRSFDIVLPHF